MPETFDTLFLLALPASGKSELRRYLDAMEPGRRADDLHVADPIHLDDYPYVHLMRCISRQRVAVGADPVFFASDEDTLEDPRDWGTLTELIGEDWAGLAVRPSRPAAGWLLDRLDRARVRTGAAAVFGLLGAEDRAALEAAIADEAAALAGTLPAPGDAGSDGRTVVVEFARGGPPEAEPPLPAPFGYRHSLSLLPRPLLERAAVLYIWVTPEQSRRRNRERTRPDGQASILYHGVPDAVMEAEYGTDDMPWLLRTARRPGTIAIPAAGGCVDVPAVAFDNRDDLTSFLRDDPDRWDADRLALLHERLTDAVERLWAARR